MKSRTKARSIALQVLYEIDLTGHAPGNVFSERIQDVLNQKDLVDFTHQIIFGVLSMVSHLDEYISQNAQEWPLDQVAIIDRNILRIALWEIGNQVNTPLKVIINEAIELAKIYGSDSTPRFVNGVLGSLATKQNEIRQKFKSLNEEGSQCENP